MGELFYFLFIITLTRIILFGVGTICAKLREISQVLKGYCLPTCHCAFLHGTVLCSVIP